MFGCTEPTYVNLLPLGFGASIRILLGHYLWAWTQGRDLVVHEQGWTYGCEARSVDIICNVLIPSTRKSWSCYFRQREDTCSSLDVDHVRNEIHFKEAWGKAEELQEQLVRLLRLPLGASMLDISRATMRGVWLSNEQTERDIRSQAAALLPLLKQPFIALHIRRGDKAHELPGKAYMGIEVMVNNTLTYCRNNGVFFSWVFILTDDFDALETARELFGSAPVYSLASANQKGFNVCKLPFKRLTSSYCQCDNPKSNKDFCVRGTQPTESEAVNGSQSTNIEYDTRALLADIRIAAQATYYFGECHSNFGHLVQLRRVQQPETARCIRNTRNHFDGAMKMKRSTEGKLVLGGFGLRSRTQVKITLVFIAGELGSGHRLWTHALSTLPGVKAQLEPAHAALVSKVITQNEDMTADQRRLLEELLQDQLSQGISVRHMTLTT